MPQGADESTALTDAFQRFDPNPEHSISESDAFPKNKGLQPVTEPLKQDISSKTEKHYRKIIGTILLIRGIPDT